MFVSLIKNKTRWTVSLPWNTHYILLSISIISWLETETDILFCSKDSSSASYSDSEPTRLTFTLSNLFVEKTMQDLQSLPRFSVFRTYTRIKLPLHHFNRDLWEAKIRTLLCSEGSSSMTYSESQPTRLTFTLLLFLLVKVIQELQLNPIFLGFLSSHISINVLFGSFASCETWTEVNTLLCSDDSYFMPLTRSESARLTFTLLDPQTIAVWVSAICFNCITWFVFFGRKTEFLH